MPEEQIPSEMSVNGHSQPPTTFNGNINGHFPASSSSDNSSETSSQPAHNTRNRGNRSQSVTSPALNGIAAATPEFIEHLLLDPGTQRFPAVAGEAYNNLPTYPLRPSYQHYHFSLRPLSRCVVFDGCPDNPHKPSSVPIYQTATFEQPSSTEFGSYDYCRSGNPTRTALEKQVAMLEFAHAAFAFSTGMAALNCVTRLITPGEGIMVCADIYGGMHRLVQKVTRLYNITVVFVPTWDLEAVEDAFRKHPNVRLMHMETPSNPLMRITDIRALSEICRSKGCLLSVDNTMMSSMLQQPLNHGADIVVHSMTKFFGGHSDTMGGVVAVNSEDLAKKIAFYQNAEGSGLAPFDCWLFLRGIKTLALRVDAAQANAVAIATFLKRQTHIVKQLFYAGLEPTLQESQENLQKYRDFKIHMGQCKGGGSLISFCTGDVELSKRILDSLRLFKITVSFGSCNSLVEMPAYLSHASIPESERTLPEDLIRLSIGIEDANDLIDDIQQAFAVVMTGYNSPSPTALENVKSTLKESASLHINEKVKPELVTPQLPMMPASKSDVEWDSKNRRKLKMVNVNVVDDAIYLKLDKNNIKMIIGFVVGIVFSLLCVKLGLV